MEITAGGQRRYQKRYEEQQTEGQGFLRRCDESAATFGSSKFVLTGPHAFEVDGDFTMRGVSNPEKFKLTASGAGTGSGEIKGNMVFNRKNYGMNKGILFVKIADHVDVKTIASGNTWEDLP